MLAAFQAAIPDIWIAEDGTLRIVLEVESALMEGLYLANQIAVEDLYIQSASYGALQRYALMYGVTQLPGTPALGQLLFAGDGGIYIPLGTEADYDPGGGASTLAFITTQDGTIPNPGVATAPNVLVDSSGLLNGTYEYVVSFVTSQGETLIGEISEPITLTLSQVIVSGISIGGPGTVGRKLYRSLNGGDFLLVTSIFDNTTMTFTDNIPDSALSTLAPTIDTAHRILLNAASAENGKDYNVVAGTITQLTGTPGGLTSVVNQNAFVGGSDVEDIEHFRSRLLDNVREPETGSPLDVQAWAESIEGVESATVFSNDNLGTPTNGHVTVRIAGPDATIPSSDVVAEVLNFLIGKDLVNVIFHVTTFTPNIQNITVAITPDVGFTVSDLTNAISQTITQYVNSIPSGGTLYVSKILAAVSDVVGVADSEVTLPATNQTSLVTEKFVTGTIVVDPL